MAHAYSELYLNDARRTLARSFNVAVSEVVAGF